MAVLKAGRLLPRLQAMSQLSQALCLDVDTKDVDTKVCRGCTTFAAWQESRPQPAGIPVEAPKFGSLLLYSQHCYWTGSFHAPRSFSTKAGGGEIAVLKQVLYKGRWMVPFRVLVRLKLFQLAGVAALAVPINTLLSEVRFCNFLICALASQSLKKFSFVAGVGQRVGHAAGSGCCPTHRLRRGVHHAVVLLAALCRRNIAHSPANAAACSLHQRPGFLGQSGGPFTELDMKQYIPISYAICIPLGKTL